MIDTLFFYLISTLLNILLFIPDDASIHHQVPKWSDQNLQLLLIANNTQGQKYYNDK